MSRSFLTMEASKTKEFFNRALMDMGANTGIVLAILFALFLARAARSTRAKATNPAAGN